MFLRHSYGRRAMRGFRKAFVKILDKTIDLAANLRNGLRTLEFSYGRLKKTVRNDSKIVRTTFAAFVRAFVTKALLTKVIAEKG